MAFIGPYQYIDTIGEGHYGKVVQAHKESRTFAIKIMKREKFEDNDNSLDPEKEVRRFVSEAAKLIALDPHPNIVRCVGLDADYPYFVMEFVSGTDLKEWMRKNNPTYFQKLEVARCLAEGLHHLHLFSIFHRDLKHKNIIVPFETEKGPVIVDLGLSKWGHVPVRSSGFLGNIQNAAPEYLIAALDGNFDKFYYDSKCDIYSLGCILFELFVGTHPLPMKNAPEHIGNVKRMTSPPQIPEDAKLPNDLEELIRNCLHPDPDNRPESAIVIANEMRSQLGQNSLKPPPERTQIFQSSTQVSPGRRATMTSRVPSRKPLIEPYDGGIFCLLKSKRDLDYESLVSQAKRRIWLSALSGGSFTGRRMLDYYAEALDINELLEIKLLLLSPDSEAVVARSKARTYNQVGRVKSAIHSSIEEIEDSKSLLQNYIPNRFDVRLYSGLPPAAFFIVDNILYLSHYTNHKTGGNGPCIICGSGKDEMFLGVFSDHFKAVWQSSSSLFNEHQEDTEI